jgi:hypothetical protein
MRCEMQKDRESLTQLFEERGRIINALLEEVAIQRSKAQMYREMTIWFALGGVGLLAGHILRSLV